MLNEIDKKILSEMPTKNQIVKLLLGTLAGFAATKLVDKAYDKNYLRMIHKIPNP